MYVEEQSLSYQKSNINILDKATLFFYSLYFIINPFYFWSSGLPQIADFLLLFSFGIYLVHLGFKISFSMNNKSILFIGLLFILWVILVNSIWMLRLQIMDRFLFSTLFYIYNFIVFCYVLLLENKYGNILLKVTLNSILASIFIQLVIYFSQGGFTGGRHIASFNNPNQLGYYALLMMSFLMFISSRMNTKIKWLIFGLFSTVIFAFSSLSKAAIVSAIGLFVTYIFANSSNRKMKKRILIIILILSAITGIVYNTTTLIQDNQLIYSVQKRIERIGADSDDSLEGRGYYRIYEYPEYWIFGAGEGMYTRFRLQRMEFHSTLGNIQVSYGIVGTLLFLSIILMALKRDRYKSWYILVFVMAYGLTHNGIRNSLLWILFALMCSGQKKVEVINK